MSQTATAPVMTLVGDFFAGLGFARARTDRLEAARMANLLASALRSLQSESEDDRELAHRLAERLTEVAREEAEHSKAPDLQRPRFDPEEEAELERLIRDQRARALAEVDADAKRLATAR